MEYDYGGYYYADDGFYKYIVKILDYNQDKDEYKIVSFNLSRGKYGNQVHYKYHLKRWIKSKLSDSAFRKVKKLYGFDTD